MKFLSRIAAMIGLGVATVMASTTPAQAGDLGVSIHGGNWNNGWSLSYHDNDRYRGHGYRSHGYVPYRPSYYSYNRHDRHDRYDRRDRYDRYDHRHRDHGRSLPWCRSHRRYHTHVVYGNGGGYYNNSYRDDYGSASYYQRIEDMSYDTSIYYGRRW